MNTNNIYDVWGHEAQNPYLRSALKENQVIPFHVMENRYSHYKHQFHNQVNTAVYRIRDLSKEYIKTINLEGDSSKLSVVRREAACLDGMISNILQLDPYPYCLHPFYKDLINARTQLEELGRKVDEMQAELAKKASPVKDQPEQTTNIKDQPEQTNIKDQPEQTNSQQTKHGCDLQ